MDEYEKIEGDLIKLYDKYMERFRNLTFLEQQIDEYNRDEQDKADENDTNLKRMQERIREEELRLLRGNASQEILSEDAPEKLKRPIGTPCIA